MRLTTSSCRLGGTILARMKQWQLSGSTAGCATGLPAFGDGPALCRKRSRWSTRPVCRLPRQSNSDKTHFATVFLIPSQGHGPHISWKTVLKRFSGDADSLTSKEKYHLQKACFGGASTRDRGTHIHGLDLGKLFEFFIDNVISSVQQDLALIRGPSAPRSLKRRARSTYRAVDVLRIPFRQTPENGTRRGIFCL